MVTPGVIKTIDYLTNTCTVEVPLFENPNDSFPTIVTDVGISTSPGMSNGYAVDDRVLICFMENQYNRPIIIGKICRGILTKSTTEAATTSVNCDALNVTTKASIPATTECTFSEDDTVKISSENRYNSLLDMMNELAALKETCEYLTEELTKANDRIKVLESK